MARTYVIKCDVCDKRHDCDSESDIPPGVAMVTLWDDKKGAHISRHVCADDHRCFTKLVRLHQGGE